MFLEILLFSLLGIAGGVISGLIPGIHTNTMILLLLGLLPLLAGFPLQAVIALIISMAVTHTIVDFIPSVFLGAPEDSTALSVLPGHKLLLEGKGLEAIYLTVIGGIGVVILFVLLIPLLLKALPFFYGTIKYYIHWILLAIVVSMVLTEKGTGKFWGLTVFILSGLLGLIVLNSVMLQPQFVFFPLFTGLFGISTLLISLRTKAVIPKQIKDFGLVKKTLALSGIIKGFFSGLVVGILPGVGAAQAGTLVQQITRKEDTREFLVSLGGINTAYAIFSLMALHVIGRPRSGAAVAVERLVESFGFNEFLLLVAAGLVAVGIGAIVTLFLSKRLVSVIEKASYPKISLGIISFLVLLTILFTGYTGLLVLLVSTAIGLIAPLTKIKRSFCMGVLILPVILWYSGLML